jgi:predicted ribosomally synthesized peptide with SipW-like signal peptide
MTAVRRRERALLSLVLFGLAALVAGGSAWSAFSATTTNERNEFATGTVEIGDNDGGSWMYQVSGETPGVPVDRCIAIAYTGSAAANVRLFTTFDAPVGSLADHIDVTITPGTLPGGTAYPSCTGFTAAGASASSSTLGAFAAARGDWASGLPLTPPGETTWTTGDTVVYRFRLTLATTAPQGASTGEHSFTWEARSL